MFFTSPVSRVVVVLCNPRVDPSVYTDLIDDNFEVEIYYLDNFDPDEHLSENDVLVYEDVSELNDLILSSVNVYAHHLKLASLFIVVQSLFGTSNKNFRTLLTLVHKVVLFGNRGSARLGRYLNQFFFNTPELKTFVELVFQYAEKNQDIVLLDINETRKADSSCFFAISGLQNFFSSSGPIVVFPQLFKQHTYDVMVGHEEAEVVLEHLPPALPPPGSFVLVRSENVFFHTGKNALKGSDGEKERRWKEMIEAISEDIESSFVYKKVKAARSLARSILLCNDFEISNNFKSIMVQGKPESSSSLIDFLTVALRSAGPKETKKGLDNDSVLFAAVLLSHKMPKTVFKNKLLLKHALLLVPKLDLKIKKKLKKTTKKSIN